MEYYSMNPFNFVNLTTFWRSVFTLRGIFHAKSWNEPCCALHMFKDEYSQSQKLQIGHQNNDKLYIIIKYKSVKIGMYWYLHSVQYAKPCHLLPFTWRPPHILKDNTCAKIDMWLIWFEKRCSVFFLLTRMECSPVGTVSQKKRETSVTEK